MTAMNYLTKKFESHFTYTGSDLGAVWSPAFTHFRVWAPTATAVDLNLYHSGTSGTDDRFRVIPMTADQSGTWIARLEGDQNGVYYTYNVTVNGESREACDPYAKAVGVNGLRAMVINLNATNPQGWDQDTNPHGGMPITDAVICEQHIRDFSSHASSGIRNKGKYLGVVEEGTVTPGGIPTGLDHLKQLGITHLQLMPMYDYGSVDETKPDGEEYNWGYDPLNFNVPEGSYSSDPYHGEVRIRDVKEMILGLHRSGISVVMDVVYNHVYNADTFCFNRIVPGYFSRTDRKGSYTNDCGCGNDTASERPMVRKFIVDSVKFWADEYHIDGFRFDLAGLIDIQTIREVVAQVRKTHPNVIFYGEGWDMCTAAVAQKVPMTVQKNAKLVRRFGFFNDKIRNLIRGSVFKAEDPGFVCGRKRDYWDLAFCYAGLPGWTDNPEQSINYISCHDNHTLFDKISESAPKATLEQRIRMNKLAAAFILTARGVPLFLGGEEMLRSKPDGKGGYDHNSYRSPDAVNSVRWDTLDQPEYRAVANYYKGLIAFRKQHPQLRNGTPNEVVPLDTGDDHCVAYTVKDNLLAVFHAGTEPLTIPLPKGTWQIFVDGDEAGNEILLTVKESLQIPPICPLILIRKE